MSPWFYFITTKIPGSANISSSRFPWAAFSLLCVDVDNLLCVIIISSCFSSRPGKGVDPPVLLVLAASFYPCTLY